MKSLFARASVLALGSALAASPAFAQSADTSVDELVVTGQRLSQQKAIQHKKDSETIGDTISADDIGRLADKNAAENLERLPGVSLKYDQGEGRYVSIRGVDGSLNNVTVNGVQLGSPDPDTRQMPLDVVSGQLTARIEVVKAVTPDMDAQGIGGAINLVTQSPFDFGKDLFGQGLLQVGSQDLNDKTPVAADASLGALFGPDKSWGVLVGVTYSNRDYRTYGIYPDDWRDVAGTPRGLPTNIKYTTYDLDRERLGFSGALEFKPTDDDHFHLRGVYSKFKEDEYRQRYRLDFATDARLANAVLNADGTGVTTGAERRQDLRLEKKDKTVSTLSFGGEHRRGDWKLDYDLSYVHNELDEPNQVWQFRGGSLTVDFDMNPLLYTATPRVEAAPSALGFRQYTVQANTGEQTAWAGVVNLRRDLAIGDEGYFKIGLKYRDTETTQDANNTTYTRASSSANRFSLADYGLLGAPTATQLDGRTYPNAPTIDAGAIQAFTAQNLSGPLFVLDTTSTLEDATLSDYTVEEKLAAGYAMASATFGAWTVLGGVRVEAVKADVDGFRLVNGTTVQPVSTSADFTDVLPNLHVTYRPVADLVVRAAATQTLGRPEYPQLSPGGGTSFEEATPGRYEGSFSEGNADLKPYKSTNLDLSAEWYFAKGGLLSGAVFYKKIKDPIFGYSETRTNYTFEGRTYDTFDYSQPRNGDEGTIKGIELAYQQQFTMLPGFWSGFGVSANATFTDSELKVPGRTDDLPFPRQSDSIYGAQIFYQKYGIQASLNYHWTSKYQDSFGGTAADDTFFNDFERIDAKVSYEVTRNISVFVEGQNLNDEVLWEYQGHRPDWIIGYERYGATYYAGLQARW